MQLGLDFNLVEDLVAGVDEVGRGPLCGPVVTAAVILDPSRPILGLNDSKKLSEARREALFEEIREKALAWCIARAEVEEIDRLNILHATMLAMQRAVEGLSVIPRLALIDGNRCPKTGGALRAGGQGRQPGAGDRCGVDPGQGQSRPGNGRAGPGLSGLWHGRAQGISDRGPSRGAFPPRPDADPSTLVCAGSRIAGRLCSIIERMSHD